MSIASYDISEMLRGESLMPDERVKQKLSQLANGQVEGMDGNQPISKVVGDVVKLNYLDQVKEILDVYQKESHEDLEHKFEFINAMLPYLPRESSEQMKEMKDKLSQMYGMQNFMKDLKQASRPGVQPMSPYEDAYPYEMPYTNAPERNKQRIMPMLMMFMLMKGRFL